MQVIKADGTKEEFDSGKLRTSLLKAGADGSGADDIVNHIQKELQPETKTAQIYNHAFQLLKQQKTGVAARYALRRSLADLGPSGFPFERFVSELFKAQGFTTKVDIDLEGKCTTHEVDVLAENDEKVVIAEVKFHHRANIKSDVKVPLYIYARFQDLQEGGYKGINVKDRWVEGWLITNTKFTSNAIKYGECSEITMLGWSHPKNENLAALIEDAGLQPITTLTTLSGTEKRSLMHNDIVLCRTLRDKGEAKLLEIGVSGRKAQSVIEEARAVCHL